MKAADITKVAELLFRWRYRLEAVCQERPITKTHGTRIKYAYDASGNRISKIVTTATTSNSTYHVRDASGNVISVYNKKVHCPSCNPHCTYTAAAGTASIT